MFETFAASENKPPHEKFSAQDIEALNERSWYLNPVEKPPFVALSVTSIGPSRETKIARTVLAGNMSENYGHKDIPKEQWPDLANQNVNRHVRNMGYKPSQLHILRPQTDYTQPLNLVNADDPTFSYNKDKATWLPNAGDFIYTYNPETVLGVRPADCPIVVTRAETPEGTMLSLTHFAWRGAQAGYIEQMFDHFKQLGVDLSTARMYVSPGVEPHNFPFKNREKPGQPLEPADLFVDVSMAADGEYQGFIDLPGFVRKRLITHGITEYQIYQDTSDTSLPESGYSSHSRAVRAGSTEENSRGIFIASLAPGNPDKS